MFRKRKEEAKRVYETLVGELGEDEFRRLFEETKKDLKIHTGISPPWEDVVLTVADRLKPSPEVVKERPATFERVSVKHDGPC